MSERVEAIRRLLEDGDFVGLAEDAVRDLLAALAQVEREREIVNERQAIMDKMLRYIAFVAAGDETADSQLAVDQLKTAYDAARAEVERLKDYHEQVGAQAYQLWNAKIEALEADLARVRAALVLFAKIRYDENDWCFGDCPPNMTTHEPNSHVGRCAQARAALEGR